MCALWNRTKPEAMAAARNRQLTQALLAEVLEQRAKLRLTFPSQVTSLRELSGSLASFGPQGLDVEVSSLKSGSQSWVGTPVSCYFRVRDRERAGLTRFYTFDSAIEAVGTAPNGLVHFRLTTPRTVAHAQQRRSVRVSVDQRRMPVFMLWRELPAGADVAATPPLAQSGPQTQGRLRVENISGCGLRLVAQNALLSELGLKPQVGESLCFYFKALEGQEIAEKAFLVNATIRNAFNDPQSGETALGLEFMAEGGLNKNRRLVWTPLKANEVTHLSGFIFKWNLLDFYKEKRVDEGLAS